MLLFTVQCSEAFDDRDNFMLYVVDWLQYLIAVMCWPGL